MRGQMSTDLTASFDTVVLCIYIVLWYVFLPDQRYVINQ